MPTLPMYHPRRARGLLADVDDDCEQPLPAAPAPRAALGDAAASEAGSADGDESGHASAGSNGDGDGSDDEGPPPSPLHGGAATPQPAGKETPGAGDGYALPAAAVTPPPAPPPSPGTLPDSPSRVRVRGLFPLEIWPPGFTITHTVSQRGVHSLQASCPFHRLSHRTGCKKRCNLPSLDEDTIDKVSRALKWWCNMARDQARQREHLRVILPVAAPPILAALQADAMDIEVPHYATVLTDAELDAAADERAGLLGPPAPSAPAPAMPGMPCTPSDGQVGPGSDSEDGPDADIEVGLGSDSETGPDADIEVGPGSDSGSSSSSSSNTEESGESPAAAAAAPSPASSSASSSSDSSDSSSSGDS